MKLPLFASALLAVSASALYAHSPLDPPAVQANVDEATRLARNDLAASLFFCEANPRAKVYAQMQRSNEWFPPTRIFDDLSYIGSHFVGVFVLQTDAGLILFDSGMSSDEAENHIAPGLKELGLDPKDIKYIAVTHGHSDHFGGALWFQQHYGTPVGLSAVDWDMIERQKETHAKAGRPIPHRDQIITDGQILQVGSTKVNLYITPGHTPGTVSAIFKVKQDGKPHVISLLGSTAFPDTIEPTDITGGLTKYRKSIQRFSALSRDAGADGVLNTHLFAFGGEERLDQARALGKGTSFLIGADGIARWYGLLDHCMQASIARILAKRDAPNP
jgi:metallo-beta-lactamase class B